MKKITEQDLLDLGFQRNFVPICESGGKHDFAYYDLDVDSGSALISSEIGEETKNEDISIEIFNEPGFNKIFDLEEVKTLMKILVYPK